MPIPYSAERGQYVNSDGCHAVQIVVVRVESSTTRALDPPPLGALEPRDVVVAHPRGHIIVSKMFLGNVIRIEEFSGKIMDTPLGGQGVVLHADQQAGGGDRLGRGERCPPGARHAGPFPHERSHTGPSEGGTWQVYAGGGGSRQRLGRRGFRGT